MNHAASCGYIADMLCIVPTVDHDYQFEEEKKSPVIFPNMESQCQFVVERGYGC